MEKIISVLGATGSVGSQALDVARARGYKICIDGITVDKLKYLNRKNLDCDLMKIVWHPSLVEIFNEDKHFMDYMNKAERAKAMPLMCAVCEAVIRVLRSVRVGITPII